MSATDNVYTTRKRQQQQRRLSRVSFTCSACVAGRQQTFRCFQIIHLQTTKIRPNFLKTCFFFFYSMKCGVSVEGAHDDSGLKTCPTPLCRRRSVAACETPLHDRHLIIQAPVNTLTIPRPLLSVPTSFRYNNLRHAANAHTTS